MRPNLKRCTSILEHARHAVHRLGRKRPERNATARGRRVPMEFLDLELFQVDIRM